jgi:amino acid adenylation domain-containing protein
MQVQEIFDLESLATKQMVDAFLNTTFNLEDGPLCKMLLVFNETSAHLHLVQHHIVSDGWSLSIFYEEFMQAYQNLASNQMPLFSALPLRYVDYAAWQKQYLISDAAKSDKVYWVNQFSGILPQLELPLKQPRPAYKTFNGGHFKVEFQSTLIQRFQALLKAEQGSLFMGFLSLISMVVHRFSGQKELIIGSPVAGRDRPELQSVMGYFSNTIALKFNVIEDEGWRKNFSSVRSVLLDGVQHSAFPFDEIVKALALPRDTSRSPIFDILVAWETAENIQSGFELSGLDIQPYEHETVSVKYDFDFYFRETSNGLSLNLYYNIDLYTEKFIQHFIEKIESLLSNLLDDPDKNVSTLVHSNSNEILHENKQNQSDGIRADLTQHASNAFDDLKALWAGLFSVPFEELQSNSDFYALGGDSIKAIQLSSRLRKKGWEIKVAQLIRHSKLAQQAELLRPMQSKLEVVPFDSNVALSPIQHDFLDHVQQFGIQHTKSYYHQTVLLDVDAAVSVDGLKKVLDVLVAQHDQLRVFFPETESGISQQLVKKESYQLSFDVINLDGLSVEEQRKEILAQSIGLKKRFDLRFQPLFKVIYFEAKPVSKLLLVAHHLVIDLVSWRIIADDLQHLLENLHNGQALTLPANRNTFQHWVNLLEAFKNSYWVHAQLEFWKSKLNATSHRLVPDQVSVSNKIGEFTFISFKMPASATMKLKQLLSLHPSLSMESLLLGALVKALKFATGIDELPIMVESHGREGELLDLDVSQTVGWFTTFFPFVYKEEKLPDHLFFYSLQNQLKQIPGKGFGYLLLRDQLKSASSQIEFNFQGSFDNPIANSSAYLTLSDWETGADIHPDYVSPIEWSFAASIVGEQLAVGLRFHPERWEAEKLRALMSVFEEQLTHALESLSHETFSAGLPGNFTYNKLQLGDYLGLVDKIGKIDDVLNLSPLQEGLLFHALKDDALSGLYVMQKGYDLIGQVNASAMRMALEKLMDRYSILRTCFDVESAAVPLQLVLSQVAAEVREMDLQHLDQEIQSEQLRILRQQDLEEGFDVTKAPLIRLTLIKLEEEKTHQLWTYHHLVADGWSSGTFIKEFFELYHALNEGKDSILPAVRNYGDYIHWLNQKNSALSRTFWKNYLSEYDQVAQLPPNLFKSKKASEITEWGFTLDDKLNADLHELLGRLGVTLSAMVHFTWGILLAKYSYREDVVFGSVVSGRPATLDGVETMVGVFSNTVPVRVQLNTSASVGTLLQHFQQEQLDAEEHHYQLLSEIGSYTPLGMSLIDHLIVYENFPDIESSESDFLQSLTVDKNTIHLSDKSHYHFAIKVSKEESLHVKFRYDPFKYSSDFIQRVAEHWQMLFQDLVTHTNEPFDSSRIFQPDQAVLQMWNPSENLVEEQKSANLLSLFEQQVDDYPDHIAVQFKQQKLSFKELNMRSNQLAHYLLKTQGVQPGQMIAVRMERSELCMVVILGILKSGAAFLPIDIHLPEARASFMMEDAECLLVVDEDFYEEFSLVRGQYPRSTPSTQVMPEQLAYCMYTSGSTGLPKGVKVSHSAIINTILSQIKSFNATPGSVHLQFASLSFDASLSEIFVAACSGGKLVVVPEEIKKDPGFFQQFLIDNGIEIATIPPALLPVLQLQQVTSMKTLISAGDAAPVKILKELSAYFTCINAYGPTEASICTSLYFLDPHQDYPVSIPIGRPLEGVNVLLLDRSMQQVPIGGWGEICVGGIGLADGYHNRAELDKEKFIINPFQPGQRLYRTGDLGRWNEDGQLEFLGRIDQQVKVRGIRIEPGEIESVLLAETNVSEAAVLVRHDADGNNQLVAFVVTESAVEEIRKSLVEQLPDYMVPSMIRILPILPQNSSGKTDKKKLLTMLDEHEQDAAVLLPENESEMRLAACWMQLLNISQSRMIGRNDDFFSLGGHSILAMKLVNQIHQQFQVTLTIKNVFSYPKLAEMAAFIDSEAVQSIDAIPTVADASAYPLSPAQRRLWLLNHLEGAEHLYDIPVLLRLNGKLDHRAIKNSLEFLMQRFESLRTVFVTDKNGEPWQSILSMEQLAPWLHVQSHEIEIDAESWLKEQYQKHASFIFDLGKGPLIQVWIDTVNQNEHQVLILMHHIISDGWSMELFTKLFIKLYNNEVNHTQAQLPQLTIQYRDYSNWMMQKMNSLDMESHRQFWLQEFSGELPVLELPSDIPRTKNLSFNGRRIHFEINQGTFESLKTYANSSSASVYMTLLTGLLITLNKYTGQNDIVIGTPVNGRNHPDLKDQLGFFLNMLAIRFEFSMDLLPVELLSLVRNQVLQANEHQDFGYDMLVEALQLPRDVQHNPLFDIGFDFQQFELSNKSALEGLKFVDQHADGDVYAKFDLSFLLSETSKGVAISIEYKTAVYSEGLIRQLGQHYKNVLEMLPGVKSHIGHFQLLSPTEIMHQLDAFSCLQANGKPYQSIINQFEEIAAQNPDAHALVFENATYTYESLNRNANQLAHHLKIVNEIGKGDLVGIILERNDWAVITILAVLKTGAAFMPVDPSYPMERMEFMRSDSNCKLTINAEFLSAFFSVKDNYSCDNFSISLDPSDLAYCLYTSGSTGKPKGVEIGHGAIANTIQAQITAFQADFGNKHLQFASLSFDASLSEIFVALCSGGSLSIIADASKKDLTSLQNFIVDQEIQIATLPPVLIPLLDLEKLAGLKTMISAGEAAPVAALQKIAKAVRCINAYGPTETAICATYHVIDSARIYGKSIPIGKPINGVEIMLLDEFGLMVAYGVVGEICIGGNGLANGYKNLKELTEARFIVNPFDSSRKLYRTGDLGRYNQIGELEFVGRRDDQVKIRGYRVEISEIEFQLKKVDGVENALVQCIPDADTTSLVAYFTGNAQEELIRIELNKFLPDHMMPLHFICLAEFPMTNNGKIDRKALPALTFDRDTTADLSPNSTEELLLADSWAELLGVDVAVIHKKSDFFRLGGQSIKAIRLSNRIQEQTGIRLSMSDIFAASQLAAMAKMLTEKKLLLQEEQMTLAPISDSYPLSLAQYRIWILSKIPEASRSYHLPSSLKISGRIDQKRVELAWKMLMERHESLHTVFKENEEGEVMQFILPVHEVQDCFQFQDLTLDENKYLRSEELERAFFNHDFDLSSGPLTRILMLKIEDDCHHLHLLQHHIISDAWSMEILVKDFFRFYEQAENGNFEEVNPLSFQYKDFAVWSSKLAVSEKAASHKNYWVSRFQGDLPTFQFQSDIKRPHHKTYTGARISQHWQKEEWHAFKEWTSQNGATPFMGLLTMVTALLNRYTGEEDLILGTPLAGRDHPQLKDQIGFYLGALPLRIHFHGEMNQIDLLSEVKKTVLEAFEHKDFSFDALVDTLHLKRDNSRHPIFDLWFDYHEWNEENIRLPEGLVWEAMSDQQHEVVAKFDCSFLFTETLDGLDWLLEYNRSLYTDVQMIQFSMHLKAFIGEFIKGTTPISTQMLLLDVEQNELKSSFGSVKWTPLAEEHLISRFEASLPGFKNQTAIRFNELSMTYRELNEKANQFSHYLIQSHEIEPDQLVAIQLPRTESMVVALLGIMKAGAAFVPIDLQYPEARVEEMLQQCNCTLIVDEEFWENFLLFRGQFSRQNPFLEKLGSHLAYGIFTSGSSGVPKAVQIEHRSLMNYLDWAAFTYHVQPSERVWLFSSLSFDFTITQLFLPLLLGKELVLADPNQNLEQTLAEVLDDPSTSVIKLTPSHLSLVDAEKLASATAKLFVMGGEALLSSHVNLLLNNKGCIIFNEYGPTETTVGSVVMKITSESQQPLIGAPIWNTDLYVLDKNSQLVPKGAAGELCIGGFGLARGYANQPEFTAEKFIPHPFDPSRKIYKTGDLVRWTNNGLMEYLGRIDQQVKIRGYRIEPGEIENKIKTIPGLEQVAVLPFESPQGDLELIAFYKGNMDWQDVSSQMKSMLPGYMQPYAFIQVSQWPMTVNGKLDKKELLQKVGHDQDSISVEIPTSFQERKMADIWAEVLGVELSKIGLDTDFFDLGGQSLKAIRLVNRLNRELNMQVSVSDLFSSGTIRSIAKKYPQGLFKKTGDSLVRFHKPEIETNRYLFYIPPIVGIPVGPDELMFGLKEHHTFGFLYTPEEDFVSYCLKKVIETAGQDAEITIMGYSSGGNIAFEVVKQLSSAGFKVNKLLLIDSIFKKGAIDFNEEYVNQEIRFWTIETEYTRHIFSSDLAYYQNLIKSYASYMASLVNTGKIDAPIYHMRSASDQTVGFDVGWERVTEGKYLEITGLGTHEQMFFPEFASENNRILIDFLQT